MQTEYELDLTDETPESIDAGRVVPGWYKTVVNDVQETDNGLQFTFQVSDGPFKGSQILDWLNDPELADDEKRAKASRSRLAMFAKRLGLIAPSAYGKQASVNFGDAVGKECWLKVHLVEQTDGEGRKVQRTRVEFDGIYALDDERVPEQVRKGKGHAQEPVPAAGKKTAAVSRLAAATKADPYGDL